MRFGFKASSRYELRGELAAGAMGIVYRGLDKTTGQEVALKTLKEDQDADALRRFHEECKKLAGLPVHPNLIEIRDVAELPVHGITKPFLVMPLIQGQPLSDVLAKGRLPVGRAIDIILQMCRGLQAAHDSGVIHRDLKPSNIFVLDDDSIKLIDFGLAHFTEAQLKSTLGAGTPLYRAPEQVLRRQLTPASDLFAAGVVAYEMLAGRPPFSGETDAELDEQICRAYPPAVSTYNPSVDETTSRVIHKAIAKLPDHRFASARIFAETLDRAARGQKIDVFDPARIQPRLKRAGEAYDRGELEYARELVDDLADEHLGDDIWRLRARIEQRARDQRVEQLVETARARMEEGEFTIALRSIQEARQLDQSNREVRLLQQEILNTQSQEDIERWRELARQHLANYRFDHAREALGHVLEKRPHDESAERALSEIRKIEAEYLRTLQQKQQLYESAVGDFDRGHIGTALGKIKRVLDLDGQAPERSDPQEASRYQKFFREVSAEQDALNAAEAQVKKLESSGEFAEALRVCDQVLNRFPEHAVFEGLRLRVEDRQRQELSSFIVEVDRRIQDEVELSKQLAIAADARARFPGEQHFVRRYEIIRRKKELVDGTIAKAKSYEEAQLFGEAAAEFRSLREIYPQYPDLDFQVERLDRRRAQQEQSQRKAELLEEIELKLEAGDADAAVAGIRKARLELGADADWDRLESRTAEITDRRQRAEHYFAQARTLLLEDNTSEGLAALRQAAALDPGNQSIRRYFLGALLAAAKRFVHDDWRQAEPLLDEALRIDPSHEFALSLRAIVADTKREAVVAAALARVSELEEANPRAAFETLRPALEAYPNEPRLNQAQSRLVRRNGPAIQQMSAAAGVGESVRAEAFAPAVETPLRTVRRRLRSHFTRVDDTPRTETGSGSAVGSASAMETPYTNAAARPPASPLIRRVPHYVWVIAGIVVVAVSSAGVYRLTHTAAAKARPAGGGRLQIRVTPPDAKIFVNGEEYGAGELYTLKPGVYRVEARLAGYDTQVIERAEVRAGETLPLDLTLTRPPLAVVLETNLDSGKVRIDAEPERDLAGGLMPLPTLAAGRHSLSFNDGQHAFTLAFTVNNNAPAEIDRAVKASSLILLAANSHGGQTTLFSSKPGISVQFDDGPPVKMDAAVAGAVPQSGTHKLTVIDGGDRWDKQIQFGPESRLSIHAFASVDRGGLVVNAGMDDATVWVDTRPQRVLTKNGVWKQSLRVGPHTIAVTKDGFERPAEQRVEIKRGGEVSSTFILKPLVTVGALHLKSSPGAEVSIDGRSSGTVPAGGTLVVTGLNTGSVNVRVTKRGHSPAERSLQITVGDNSYELPAGVQLPGRARLPALPAGAKVTYHRKGESAETVFDGQVKDLPEGEYVFNATAPGYLPVKNFSLTIVADADNAVPFNMEREPAAAPVPVRSGMQGWPADAFRPEDDGWYAGSKAGVALYQASQAGGGIYSLQIQSPGSKKLKMFGSSAIELYAAYENAQNHLTLRLEEKRLSCVWVESGHNKGCGEIALAKSDQHSLRLELGKTKVQVSVDGKSLPPFESPAADFASGKFAIKSEPGKLRIKDFRYEAR